MSKKCKYCGLRESEVFASNVMALAIAPEEPLTDGHLLIIPRRHVDDYFDLSDYEKGSIDALQEKVREELEEKDASIDGFNVLFNIGESAGHTEAHGYIHMIPRRHGDAKDPAGGVRRLVHG